MDFRQCTWPSNLLQQSSFTNIHIDNTLLSQLFSELNNKYLSNITNNNDNNTIISFSHFLPRIECLIEKRFLFEPHLAKVSGSIILENQIRQLNPHLHLVCYY
jgi:hypothetical protein